MRVPLSSPAWPSAARWCSRCSSGISPSGRRRRRRPPALRPLAVIGRRPRSGVSPSVPDDAGRQHDLRRMKAFATGLLLFAAVVFLVALGATTTGRRGSATSGPAPRRRWSARSPTGSPSPRCSATRSGCRSRTRRSSPSARTRSAAASASSSQGNFLTRRCSPSASAGPTSASASALARRAGERRPRRRAVGRRARAARSRCSTTSDVQEGLEQVVERRIDATPAAPLLGRAIDVASRAATINGCSTPCSTALRGFLDDNRATFRERLSRSRRGGCPSRSTTGSSRRSSPA